MDMFKTIPVADSQVISKLVEGEMILLHPTQGKVRVLNEVGARIWELIDGINTVNKIAQFIYEEFAVESLVAEADVSKFINQLENAGLIILKTHN